MSREELPFEVIQTWKPEQLKEFCGKRDLKISGPKAELVARVFAAAEMGIAIKPTALERIGTIEKEKAKLVNAKRDMKIRREVLTFKCN